ncbi:MAG: ABC transporter permease [Candidatus Saccharimonadia bacterium]
MSKLSTVVGFEVLRNLKKKTFWYTTLAVPVMIIAVFAITQASSNHAANNSQQQSSAYSKTAKVAVLDETGLLSKQELVSQRIITEPNQQAGIDAVKSGDLSAFIYYPKDITKVGIEVYAQDQGITFTPPYSDLAALLLNRYAVASVSLATQDSLAFKVLQTTPNITATTYKNGKETNGLAAIVAPIIFFSIFLFFVAMLSYFMISATTEEKENRAAEILLTTISSRILIIGKILSIFILGLVQVVIITVPLLIGYAIFHNQISLPGGVSLAHIPLDPKTIVVGAVVLSLGLVMFTGILVGFGSLFPSSQEASRYLGIIILSAFIPLYAIGFVIGSPHAAIVTVLTYFPLTSPSTVLLRNAVGTLSTGDALGAIALLAVAASLAIMFAIRAFNYGAMAYSRRISIKELF